MLSQPMAVILCVIGLQVSLLGLFSAYKCRQPLLISLSRESCGQAVQKKLVLFIFRLFNQNRNRHPLGLSRPESGGPARCGKRSCKCF